MNKYFEKINLRFKQEASETLVRANIISQVLNKYSQVKASLQKNDPLYKEKKHLYKPKAIYTFYTIFLPIYFINTNIYILFKMRKDFSIFKYFIVFSFNLLSLSYFFTFTDKKIFIEYISKPNPYSKFMREEFLSKKDQVTARSYKMVENINDKINSTYKI